MTTLPLAGYRVLELAHLIAGPVCGMYLADMGADVVKVEHPVDGDASRLVYGTQYGAESAVFVTVNRNKRSVALDLGRAEGLALFRRLVADADVVVEAYRGGVAERLGIDYGAVAPLNPRLIYCSLSAFGPGGAGIPTWSRSRRCRRATATSTSPCGATGCGAHSARPSASRPSPTTRALRRARRGSGGGPS